MYPRILVPRLAGATVARGRRCRVSVAITNMGDAAGEFKLIGFVYSSAGPYASDSYGDPSGYYGRIENWIGNSNTRGTALEGFWVTISPGGSMTVYANSVDSLMWTGPSHIYLVGAVRYGGSRLSNREHYRFFPNAFQVT